MRVLFLSQYFHPEQFSNNAIARALVRRGHEVHAVTCVPNYPDGRFLSGYSNASRREEQWEGIHIHRAFTIPRGERKLQLIANFLVYPFAATWTAFRRMGRRAEISFVSMPSPLLQALAGIFTRWLRGTPTVYWVQDIWPESAIFTLGLEKSPFRKPLNWLCGWIYRRADLILVQSAAFPAMIERYGVPTERIRVFPNTAPDFYRPMRVEDAAEEESALVPANGFRLMFAGNIGESQDFETLIAAANLLRDRRALQWVIVGSGRAMEKVKRDVEQCGLIDRFHFLGRFPEEVMPHLFANADAMLVSLKDYPIFSLTVPYKVQTYMACAKPIVASLNGEGSRIIQEARAGLVAPASSPRILAKRIARMMESTPAEREAWGRNSRRYFDDHYEAEMIYDRLAAWLEEIAARGLPDTKLDHDLCA